MDTLQIKGLDDVNHLLGQLSSEDLEERTHAWRDLRKALFTEPAEEHHFQEIGKSLIQEIEATHKGSLKEGESALRHWVESQPSFEARVGALRVLGRFAGLEKKVWQDVLLALATDDQGDVDLRAWAIYTLHWARLDLTKKNWGDVGQRLIDHCLNAPQAKVRQWAALALGEMATYGRPEKAKEERTRLADSYTHIAAETALIQRWGGEIDLYVARQLIISLGKAGGHVHKSIDGRTIWPVIQILEEAAGDDRYEVCQQVPHSIERVAKTLLAAPDVPAGEKTAALNALLKILGLWFEQPGGDYETYRAAITAIADLVSLVLNNPNGQVLLETQTEVTEAGLQLLFSIAESQKLKGEEAVRDRALRAVQYIAEDAPDSARQIVASAAVPQLQCMLADPSAVVAGQTVETLIALSGEEPAAEFFADVILQDSWAAKAVSHRAAAWGLEEGADVEALEHLVRRRAALAIGRISRNQAAHDRLVESLKQREGITYQRANEALKAMGGQKAVQALIESTKQQWVESKFFNPIEEADQHGRKILNATVWMSVISYLVTLGAAVIVLWFGAGLLSSSVQKIQASGAAQLTTTVEAIAGAIAAIAGLLLPFFWNPSGAVQKANAEMTKLVTAFHGYMGRMRLLGLGFAHAYTEDRADTNFLLAISHAAGDAMVDSAGVLTDVGAWPGVNKGVVQVPDFKGMTWSEAAEAAKARSLQITMKEQAYNDEIAEGKVTAQSLPAETLVELGTTLALTLSKGKQPEEPVTLSRVPVFANKSWEEAEQLARENALTLTFDQIAYNPLIAENRLVSQDPKAGIEVAPGTLVRLTVSKGAEPEPEIVVPQFVGMTWDAAQVEAGRTQLKLTARHIYSEQAEGTVVDQTPTAEVVIHPETSIALLVSKGPAPNAQAAPTFTSMTWDKALIEALRSNVVLVLDKLAYDDRVPEGTIVAQNLQPGMMITPGTVILLTVSKGPSPALTTVPNFIGETEGTARKLAVEYYLESEVAETVYGDQPEGQILAQELPEGLEVKQGTPIRLTVSGGPRPAEVSEPEGIVAAAPAPVLVEEIPVPAAVEASETAAVPPVERARTEGGGGGVPVPLMEPAAEAAPGEGTPPHAESEAPAGEGGPAEEVTEVEALPPDLLDLTSEFDFSSITRPEPTPPPAPPIEEETPKPRARVMKSRRQVEEIG